MASLFGNPKQQNQWFGNQMSIPQVGSGLLNPTQTLYPGYGHTAFPQPGGNDYVDPIEEEERRRREEEEERLRIEREIAQAAQLGGGGLDPAPNFGPGITNTAGNYHDPNDPYGVLGIYASSSGGPSLYGIPITQVLNEWAHPGIDEAAAQQAATQIANNIPTLDEANSPLDTMSDPAFNALIGFAEESDATANAAAAANIATNNGPTIDAFGGAGPSISADGPDCFITTAIVGHIGEADDGPTLTALRKFRDSHMGGKKSDQLQEYYRIAPRIIEKIEAREDAHDVFLQMNADFIQPAVLDIHANRLDAAYEKYVRLVNYAQTMAGLEAA